MGRPAKFDRVQAISEIMNAIWKDGYEACSVKAISEQLGITRSSYYHAFKSREDLFLEALALYSQTIPAQKLYMPDERTPILKLISTVFQETCQFLTSQPEARGCMIVNSVTELVGSDPKLGPVIEDTLSSSKRQFEVLLQKAVENGEIAGSTDVVNKALALQNLLMGINVMSKVITEETELWAIAKQTLDGLQLYAE